MTDGELMQAVQAGDGQAFAALVHRYHAPLQGYLLRLTQDPHLADDLVQETFLRMYTRADTFGTGRALRPWLYRIATNLFFDWHRRCRDMPAGLATDGAAAGFAAGADPAGDCCARWRACSARRPAACCGKGARWRTQPTCGRSARNSATYRRTLPPTHT